MVAKFAYIGSPCVDARRNVSSHVLDHISLLSVAPRAVLADVGPDAFVHPHVVEDAPRPGELFVSALVAASVEGRESAITVSSFFDFASIV